MGRMNLGRIVVGGLIAGFAYNVVNWIGHGLILEAVSTDTMAEPHIAPPSIGQRVQLWSIWMLYGVMVAWLYAAMRPRFGEGFRTAAFAATTVWIVGIVVPALPNWVLGFFSLGTILADLLVGIVGLLIGAVLAGLIYQEPVLSEGTAPK